MPPLQNAKGQTADDTGDALFDLGPLSGAGWIIVSVLLGAMSAGFCLGVAACFAVVARAVPHV